MSTIIPITQQLLELNGFVKLSRVTEKDFYYEDFRNENYPSLRVFLNHFNNGNTTNEVVLADIELDVVSESDFMALLRMLGGKRN